MDKIVNIELSELCDTAQKANTEIERLKADVTELKQVCNILEGGWGGEAEALFVSSLRNSVTDVQNLIYQYERSLLIMEESIKKYTYSGEEAIKILHSI